MAEPGRIRRHTGLTRSRPFRERAPRRRRGTLDGSADDGSTEDDNGVRRDNIGADVENLTGGRGNDTLNGSSAANRLTGFDEPTP